MTHRLLKQMKVPAKAKEQPAADGIDGHMAKAIQAAVMPEVREQIRDQLRDLPAMVREEVQATASAQLSLQARRHAAGAFDELSSRQTRLEQTMTAPVPVLGDAELDVRIRRHVSDQLARQRPVQPQAPDYQPPAMPQAPKAMPVITMQRGRDGKIVAAHVGNLSFIVERDSAGKAMALVPQEASKL